MTQEPLGPAISKALGLPETTTKFSVTFEYDKPPVVHCEYFVIKNDELTALFADYELQKK